MQKFTSNYRNLFYMFTSVGALLLGGFIYVLWRPVVPAFFKWTGIIEESWFISLRQFALNTKFQIPEWAIYSLPDGLWAFAYSIIITRIWWKSKSLIKYLWLITIPVFILGFEVLQYFKIIGGTFCLQDMTLEILGLTIGIYIGIKLTKLKYYEKGDV